MKSLRLRKYNLEKSSLVNGERVWVVEKTIWLKVKPVTVRWQSIAGAEEAKISHLAFTRWQSGIFEGNRFRRGNDILEIYGVVDPDGSERRLQCYCRAIKVFAQAAESGNK